MEIEKITEDYAVTGQLAADELSAVKDGGFASIICNRPDGEKDDQPTFEEIAAAADAVGLSSVHIPVVPTDIREEHVDAFRAAVMDLPKPILAYCFTGGRAKMMWGKMAGDKG